jgi:2-haloacid dehalogenase
MRDAVAELAARHPDERHLIEAYRARWPEMLGGAVDGSVAILEDLRAKVPALYALSNWPAETFPHARARFGFLEWFDGMVVSGEVGMRKPDHGIYRLLLERYRIEPSTTLFIDDLPENLAPAEALGLTGLRFTSADRLRADLARFDLA